MAPSNVNILKIDSTGDDNASEQRLGYSYAVGEILARAPEKEDIFFLSQRNQGESLQKKCTLVLLKALDTVSILKPNVNILNGECNF